MQIDSLSVTYEEIKTLSEDPTLNRGERSVAIKEPFGYDWQDLDDFNKNLLEACKENYCVKSECKPIDQFRHHISTRDEDGLERCSCHTHQGLSELFTIYNLTFDELRELAEEAKARVE